MTVADAVDNAIPERVRQQQTHSDELARGMRVHDGRGIRLRKYQRCYVSEKHKRVIVCETQRFRKPGLWNFSNALQCQA